MRKFIYTLLLSCLILPLTAKDYKVATTAEFNSTVKTLQPGDCIILAKGIWKDAELVFFGEGTKEQPITLRVEESGKTTLEGLSSLKLYGNYLIVDGLVFVNGYTPNGDVIEFRKGTAKTANNSIVRNCVIDRYNQPNRLEQDTWISLWGQNNQVVNCYLGGKTNLGTTLIVWPNGEGHSQNYHRIYRNYFAARPRLGSNGGETMRIGTSHYSMENSNTIVEGNYFEHCNGEVEVLSVKSCENRIINNTFFECEGSVVLRHGNRNEVSGNYFLGNHKPSTGGVRVINEGHKVFNNYFHALKGKDFRGPLVIMNGVPNSVQNRYHQVKNVEIYFNTWVDCELPWQLCVGSDEERTAIPLTTKIAHNIVYCPEETELIKAFDKTTGIQFADNLLIGSKGVEKGTGFVQGSVEKSKSANELPQISSNLKTNDNVPFVTTDIDGRSRGNEKAIGAIENKGKATIEIASSKNCGPSWYTPAPAPTPNGKIISVKPEKDALLEAVKTSKQGDIIELKEGVYFNSKKIAIPHTLTIRAAKDAKSKPVLQVDPANNALSVLEVGSNLNLNLNGITLDGNLSNGSVKYAIATIKEGIASSYNMYIDNCEFANFKNEEGGAIYKAYKGSFADTLTVTNSIFRDSYRGFALNDEKEAQGFYSAEFMTFENVVFKNIQQWAIDFLRGGNDESTLGGHLTINHCVFDNVNNNDGQTIIKQTGLVTINITNSVFFNSPKVKYPVRLAGRHNKISFSNIYNAGKTSLTNEATEGAGMIYTDPKFKTGTYVPEPKSPLINKASDSTNIGLKH
ncbi:poly(beta-D-mannuronate) lyase [Dysgonomonas alginatilytica]|uniref:Poly(Beta-D-mannuronate) lyase n=1 Tax=Dysgonomonas alginatilytica TaxID=1605892 RepID=A0A2V3Q0C4_9BACT|nr:chondroitinase-B domain-containing protein [Dysgonomonas alginatilytica]PXV68755.1 poly(beta-D-mannuronate) lyase [Dysgonomonas alginatilytica]BAR73166.1 putative alginate lyase [uncultured bacterium]